MFPLCLAGARGGIGASSDRAHGAVILLRRKAPFLKRPYRTIGYPAPVLIYIALAVLLVLDFVYLAPQTSGIGYLIVLTGIPVYFVWARMASPRVDARTDS